MTVVGSYEIVQPRRLEKLSHVVVVPGPPELKQSLEMADEVGKQIRSHVRAHRDDKVEMTTAIFSISPHPNLSRVQKPRLYPLTVNGRSQSRVTHADTKGHIVVASGSHPFIAAMSRIWCLSITMAGDGSSHSHLYPPREFCVVYKIFTKGIRYPIAQA